VKKDGKYFEYSSSDRTLQVLPNEQKVSFDAGTKVSTNRGMTYDEYENDFGDYINSNTYKAKKSQNDNIIV
jgi:hypothetical protein